MRKHAGYSPDATVLVRQHGLDAYGCRPVREMAAQTGTSATGPAVLQASTMPGFHSRNRTTTFARKAMIQQAGQIIAAYLGLDRMRSNQAGVGAMLRWLSRNMSSGMDRRPPCRSAASPRKLVRK